MISLELQKVIEQMTTECERLTMTDIQVYDVKGISPLTDVVFIATASHILQLDAARRSLSLLVKQAGYPVQNPTEDYSEGWLVLDCVDLVVHVLVEDKRAFYNLDGLMKSIKEIRSDSSMLNDDDDEELTEQQLSDLLEMLTPEEAEEFLASLEQRVDD